MRQLSLPLITLATLTAPALAQFTLVAPAICTTVEGNSNNIFPWGRTTDQRYQQIFDSTTFSGQSVGFPVLINNLRFRADSATASWPGGMWPGPIQIRLSTSPVDFLAFSTTFASNQGPDITTVHNGPVTKLPGTSNGAGVPSQWFINIPLSTPFLYDPSLGDLTLDVFMATAGFTGTVTTAGDAESSTSAFCSRLWADGTATAVAAGSAANYGIVTEFGYVPAAGLYAGFTANVTAGPVPTTVNFSDATFTSDPGGVTSWAWDLNGDTVTDSTLQNPSFTYAACGAYNVRLTVTDATHPASTLTRTGYIQIGVTPITPSYTVAPLAPGVYQFTDTSTPLPASWAWDFNGDMIVDSTAQNPVWAYAACTASANVTLSVSSTCAGPWSTSGTLVLLPPIVPSFTFAAIVPGVYQFTDTSTPTPATWAWDLNGDMVVDSTAQNPVWPYPAPCTSVSVTLTVTSACAGPWSTSRPLVLAPLTATAVPFSGGNGTVANPVGNMFDVTVTAAKGISICGFTQGIYTYVGPFTANIYVTDNTYIGKEANAAAWRLVASGSGTSAGGPLTPANSYPVALSSSFYLPAGNYGIAIFLTQPSGSMNVSYTNGPLGPFVNPDITFFPNPAVAPGRSNTGLFTGTGFTPRCWNGAFHYTKFGNGDQAGYGFMGSGCAGTLPVARLTPNHPPMLGSTMTVAVNNLPTSAALLMTGFSNTTSLLGPLPIAGAAYGAPGCNLRVSPDANLLLIGAANTANWNFTIPNAVAFIGQLLYNQAIVFNPGFNGAGAVISDAAAMMIGN